ncbi:kinase-like domain-containing protein [Mycena sanguinolenta]|nr:kinase-like domain-containing protein [Mycena sanguinolenta]
MAEDNPNAACSGGEDACLRHFDYKTSDGRCHKCSLLTNASVEEHPRILGLPQCHGCGNTSARLTTDYCGSCERKQEKVIGSAPMGPSVPTAPFESQIQKIGQYHRANWKDAANINNSNIKAQQSSVPITSSNMAALRSNNLATTECYAFILEPFINLKPCDYLPTFDVTREASTKLFDLLESAVACFNSSWEEDSEAGLDRHVPASHYHCAILKDCGQNLDKTVPPKFRTRKFVAVYLEAHINLDKFYTRTGASPPKNAITAKSNKRTWSPNASTSGGSILKRSRLVSGGPRSLKSAFVLVASPAPVPAPARESTSVTLFFAQQTSDPVNGLQQFVWNTDNPTPKSAMLENSPCNKGRSKLVFKLTFNGVAYVAKRCYAIGSGSPITIIANRDQLVKEGVTLGRASYFLHNFNKECDNEDVEISKFEVTDFILAREGVVGLTDPFTPSPASGIELSDYISLSDTEKDLLTANTARISSVTWLLERERGNVQLRKYSGTLDHLCYSDKQGATINVFQHFSYLFSNKTLVLADIQASESYNPSNKASVLFDLMSHTLDGPCSTSGAGDHGVQGIKTFLDQHQCVQKCAQMGLKALKDSEEEEEEEEEVESEEPEKD